MEVFKPFNAFQKPLNEGVPHNQLRHELTGGDFYSASNVIRTDKNLVIKESFSTDDNGVSFLKGQSVTRRAVSSNYSTAATDFIVAVTSLALARSIGLPRPRNVGVGKIYVVKDEAGGAGSTTITVRSEGEETIDGATTSTLTTNYQSRRYYTDGANWFTY